MNTTDLTENFKRVMGFDPREPQATDPPEIAEALGELNAIHAERGGYLVPKRFEAALMDPEPKARLHQEWIPPFKGWDAISFPQAVDGA
jgi:hypothetical protein